MISITKEWLNHLMSECDKHNELTDNGVDVTDILYSALNPGYILRDWNEGPNNDPHWNVKLNQHSAIVFINEMVKFLNQ